LYDLKTLETVVHEEPNTRFITLACQHVFTVESLDGHFQMGDFYEQDDIGRWTGIKDIKPEFIKRPTCPACHGPVDSLRYKRVTNRALIDIQEQHALQNATSELRRIRKDVSAIQPGRLAVQSRNLAPKMSHIKSVPQPNPRLGDALFLGSNDQRCIESGMFFGEVDKWFGITGQAAFA
jgi:hypothetical protein